MRQLRICVLGGNFATRFVLDALGDHFDVTIVTDDSATMVLSGCAHAARKHMTRPTSSATRLLVCAGRNVPNGFRWFCWTRTDQIVRFLMGPDHTELVTTSSVDASLTTIEPTSPANNTLADAA